ncbi:ferredoxin [Streptomyces piniterrae]|uniref:Ferredoxin n=1 Tax=Streptomyces piniterrae TaxID=2571125 RepID=A0A4U0NKD1_9ACTN|nr:ferredoxin [Streptomyces piniterrae]
MTITVDRDRCVGAGMCALTAPEVFDQDDEEGRVVVLDTEPAPAHQAAARHAAGLCPAAAITVTATDTTTHQQ